MAGVDKVHQAKKRILIYLDSQDFIRLTDERDKPTINDVYRYLIKAKEEGLIEIGFSFLHILEVLNPDSSGYEKEQRKYGETIYNLTSGCFPVVSDLIKGACYPNNGSWAPSDVASDFKDTVSENGIRKIVRDRLSENGLTRAQRRHVSSPAGRAALLKDANLDLPSEFIFLGITESEFRALMLNPTRHRRTFHEKLFRALSDPRYYCECVASTAPGKNPFVFVFKDKFQNIHQAIAEGFRIAREFSERKEQLIKSIDGELQKIRNDDPISSAYVEILNDERKKARRKMPSLKITEKAPLNSPCFAFLDHYINRMIIMSREPSPSEALDILHLVYASGVDLMRVDRRMFEIMKGEAAIGQKLVRKVEDVPARVQQLTLLSRP